ncbi:MAG: phosphopantothenoylcysteine decarboxylase [Leptolyngbya sp. PLA3]|nr:MAG: phosphopantothenoylcysteine decarboxylase [Cyanobacteria bacterium CYA]MCE7967565.1 phosphopantothenoylcysteine decarboxylase [Leptolyngbya sp. PL-A3]
MTDPVVSRPRRLLITSGPTQEPIDAVRFIGNRSSGRLGAALADAAAADGWQVTLLAGCESRRPTSPLVRISPFRTTADLERLLSVEVPRTDVLVMAAAVADYRPVLQPGALDGKTRRKNARLVLELEPTPDLLAGCRRLRRPGQVFIGFALEPREELLTSSRSKLARKGLDMVVGNPLATMDAQTIEATLVGAPGTPFQTPRSTPGPIPKPEFARWLLAAIAELVASVTEPADA